MSKSIKAILLMSGSGIRFHSKTPKQFHPLLGKKVYLHALEALLKSALFNEIILVCHPDWLTEIKEETSPYAAPLQVIPGGPTRQASSYLGLCACDKTTDYILIHDAVRPCVSQAILKNNIEAVQLHHAVDTCIPSADTLVYTSDQQWIAQIPERSAYMRGQTPQSFAYSLILEAHEKTHLKNSSDDCRLVLALSHPVKIVLGDEMNCKLTTEHDLVLAEQILRNPHTQ